MLISSILHNPHWLSYFTLAFCYWCSNFHMHLFKYLFSIKATVITCTLMTANFLFSCNWCSYLPVLDYLNLNNLHLSQFSLLPCCFCFSFTKLIKWTLLFMDTLGSLSRCVPSIEVTNTQPKISSDISQCHHWIPGKLTSEKQMQKFHTDDTSLPCGECCWLVVLPGKFVSSNQKHYPHI